MEIVLEIINFKTYSVNELPPTAESEDESANVNGEC